MNQPKYIKLAFIVCSVIIFFSCGKKELEPMKFEFQHYHEPAYKYEIDFPKGWIISADAGKLRILSSQGAYDKFVDPATKGEIGAMILVQTIKTTSPVSLQNFYDSVAASEKDLLDKYEKVEDASVAGIPAKKIYFRLKYAKDAIKTVERYLVATDSSLMNLEYISFNEMFAAYKPAFDKLISTFKMPEKTAAGTTVNENLPSSDFSTYNHPLFSIEYPDNFNIKAQKKSETNYSISLSGYRQDCTIIIDIFPSQNLSVDKVFNQNKDKYSGARGPKETSINSLKSLYLDYSLMKQISSRAYFVVKDDKVFRMTMNWYQPEESNYLKTFERVIASLKIK